MTEQNALPLRYEHRYDNSRGGFTIAVDTRARATLVFFGDGTMDGAHALIESMEAMERKLEPGEKVDAKVDLTDMRGAPIRSQFLLGKWMLGRRQRFGQLAIYGGKKVEMAVARAVMKIAGVDTVGFFDTRGDAERWLGW